MTNSSMTANASILVSGSGHPNGSATGGFRGLKMKTEIEGRNKSPSLSKSMNEQNQQIVIKNEDFKTINYPNNNNADTIDSS